MTFLPSRTRNRNAARFAAISACLSCMLLAACGNSDKTAEPAPTRQTEATAQDTTAATAESQIELADSDLITVQAGEIEQMLRANGTLRARHETVVRAKVAGEILAVSVLEGEHVHAGQELARIDPLEYQARLDDRQAALEAGRAQASLAETTRRKNEELRQKNFLSELAYDNAQSAASIANAQVQSLEAQRILAEKALRDTVVHAPISGWIAERSVQRGDKTPPDGKLFTLVDLSSLELEARVAANEIARVAIGQPFVAHVEGYTDRAFKGHVARIGAQALPGSRAITLYIEIPNPQALIKAGMFASGTLTLGRHNAQALVPLTALHSAAGVDFVYALIDGQIRRTPVKIGMQSEAAGQAEILDGLTAGTRIVAVNLGPLKENAQVRLVATRPANHAENTPAGR